MYRLQCRHATWVAYTSGGVTLMYQLEKYRHELLFKVSLKGWVKD